MSDVADAPREPIRFGDPALLAELLAQEQRLVLPHLDYHVAARLGGVSGLPQAQERDLVGEGRNAYLG